MKSYMRRKRKRIQTFESYYAYDTPLYNQNFLYYLDEFKKTPLATKLFNNEVPVIGPIKPAHINGSFNFVYDSSYDKNEDIKIFNSCVANLKPFFVSNIFEMLIPMGFKCNSHNTNYTEKKRIDSHYDFSYTPIGMSIESYHCRRFSKSSNTYAFYKDVDGITIELTFDPLPITFLNKNRDDFFHVTSISVFKTPTIRGTEKIIYKQGFEFYKHLQPNTVSFSNGFVAKDTVVSIDGFVIGYSKSSHRNNRNLSVFVGSDDLFHLSECHYDENNVLTRTVFRLGDETLTESDLNDSVISHLCQYLPSMENSPESWVKKWRDSVTDEHLEIVKMYLL